MPGAEVDEDRRLRALFVEDDPDDAELMARQLQLAGFETVWERVENERGFIGSLDGSVQIVLCDSGLPGFDALRALEILQERDHPAPLVIVSGGIGEEVAVEAMRRGAADYVLKDRLARLGQAVTRALERASAERERRAAQEALREAEERYRSIFENALEGIFRVTLDGRYLVVNPAFAHMMGFGSPEEFLAASQDPARLPDTSAREQQVDRLLREEIVRGVEFSTRRRDGSEISVMEHLRVLRDDQGHPIGMEGMSIDITERMRAERERGETEDKYRTLLERTPAIVYTWGVFGGLQTFAELYVSPQIEQVLGFSHAEWMADPTFWIDRLHPEDRDRVLAEVTRCIDRGEPIKMEYRMLAKDGSVVWLHDEARVLTRDGDDRATQFQGVRIDITERMDVEDERQRTIDQLRQIDQQRRLLLTHVVTTQDEERRRIALDIHEDTIQAFSALSIRMETLGRSHPEIRVDERFLKAERAVADSIRKLRQLIFELHPLTLESEGLVATIRAHVEALAREPGAPRFELRSGLTVVPPVAMGAAMYRIAREAITNATRHSGAARVAITFEERDAGLFVQIKDDGVGFDPEATTPAGQLGLASMRERAELAGGWSRIESRPGDGTTVSCWLPADWLQQPGAETEGRPAP